MLIMLVVVLHVMGMQVLVYQVAVPVHVAVYQVVCEE
jgi:hypothetical protein